MNWKATLSLSTTSWCETHHSNTGMLTTCWWIYRKLSVVIWLSVVLGKFIFISSRFSSSCLATMIQTSELAKSSSCWMVATLVWISTTLEQAFIELDWSLSSGWEGMWAPRVLYETLTHAVCAVSGSSPAVAPDTGWDYHNDSADNQNTSHCC